MFEHGFAIEGIDISQKMIELARAEYPNVKYHYADICSWKPTATYDFITAWDSIWHVPLTEHSRVLKKLLASLKPKGVCIFSMGGTDQPQEKTDSFMGPKMYYSSLGIPKTLELIEHSGCICKHLEFDQYP